VASCFVKGVNIYGSYYTESVKIAFFLRVTPHKDCSVIKMEAECSFETLVRLYIKWRWVTFWGESSGHTYGYPVTVTY